MSVDVSSPPDRPVAIDAVPLRHPWRWVAAIVIVVLVALFLYGAATNDAYGWSTFGKLHHRRTDRVGVVVTLELKPCCR
jgi:polar amino acid transport system permease protein